MKAYHSIHPAQGGPPLSRFGQAGLPGIRGGLQT